MGRSLLVVGSIALDTVRTPFGEAEDVLGGSATYFSVAASLFGPVRLVGVVGEDFPGAFRRVFESRRIDTTGLQVRGGGKTFRWRGSYEGSMNQAVTEEVQLNVMGDFRPEIPEVFRDTRLLFLANGSPVTQASVLDQVEGPDLVVADTMNLWIKNERDDLLALLGRIDGLVLNDAEARMLTGEDDLWAAGEKVLSWGPWFVVVKRGSEGSLLVADNVEGEGRRLPRLRETLTAYQTDRVHDPTGAGDSFAGGMMGRLASLDGETRGADLLEALEYGTVTASFTIEDFGVRRLEAIGRSDIEDRLRAHRKQR